jgi:N-acetylglucosaminyldiphosphoundecaprenol N-acetyl-beta-D-mannosaminyltransferase
MNENKHRAYEFLGIRVHALTKAELLEAIASAVASPASNSIIGNHNLHSLYLFHHNVVMRRFYDQNLFTYVDGMSLILLARICGISLQRRHRTSALDWFEEFLRMAEQNSWRIYFLGGKPEVASGVPEHFRPAFPRLQIRSHHGYDAFSTETTVYEEIEKFAPHVLLVGMGMPLQEQWIMNSLDKIQVNLISTCGATMDYYIGAQKPAPRWLGQMGLEWLYRLLHDPRRLVFRYLIEPATLVPLFFREWRRRKAGVGK